MAMHLFSIIVLSLFVAVVMKPVLINGRLDWNDAGGYADGLLGTGQAFESLLRQDYSPTAPPHPPSASCQDDLGGIGSLDTTCKVVSSLNFTRNVYLTGKGNLYILPNVTLNCSFVPGCEIGINVAGNFSLGENARILAGSFELVAMNAGFGSGSVVNTTGLAGDPPEHTSGTPKGVDGAGGGHGGRGAACLVDDKQSPDDIWGGDVYAWSSLAKPLNYGSKGGTTSDEVDYGGIGGGKISVMVESDVVMNGLLLAEGGDGSLTGGGGSGGSIYIKAYKMTGKGKISASGGNGFGGGGGGRIATYVFSRHEDPKIFVHGGYSTGCPSNAGAAGTFYDAMHRSLIVDNFNMKTDTDTLLMDLSYQPLLTSIFIQNFAKAAVPLLWNRIEVRGQISLLDGAILTFGLAHYAASEIEVIAEELLMSYSFIKVYGAMRMTVNVCLMWNSQLVVDGKGDSTVGTSVLDARNLIVLREYSTIHSNANLEVRGQGLLELSGLGDCIEAKQLALSLFYRVNIGPGSVLRGQLENATTDDMTPTLIGCMGGVDRSQLLSNGTGGRGGYGGFPYGARRGGVSVIGSLKHPILRASVDGSLGGGLNVE